jgi:putative heme-binding domain-containing protein
VEPLLKDKDAQVRVAAMRALHRQGRLTTAQFKKLATDSSPAVRREVALAMRDVPYQQSAEVLLAVAKTIDGTDRTLLEAWGAGVEGKESQVYDQVKPILNNTDPLKWSPGFTALAWRLHPAQSVGDFKARAMAASLDLKSRRDALTAIGYNTGAAAAEAMVDIAAKADGAVKADAVWWLLNRKDNVWKDHNLGPALKARGIYDPDSVELISAVIPKADAPTFSAADVLKLTGDAKRGHERFVTVCTSCHRAGDEGTEYAPNLSGWARRQTAEVFFNSVINPSADIASGFNGTMIKAKDDVEIHGLVISDGDPVVIQSAAGVIQTVPKNRITERKGLGRSLMMSADQLGVTAQDLADIQAYLRTK